MVTAADIVGTWKLVDANAIDTDALDECRLNWSHYCWARWAFL